MNTCIFRDVFKLHIAFIKIKTILLHVSRKKNVLQSIIVDIADGYTTTIIKIAIGVNIEF